MTDVQISVVIPVYNAAPYLAQCLDSALSQRVAGLEVICVDDGSTDESSDILSRYASVHANVTVLTQKNQYAGVARNYGMQEAQGEYYSLLDSDDIFESDMIEQMVAEGMLNELNYNNIPNYKNVDPAMHNLSFDPEDKYTVPYMWGTMGILYNKTMVDEEVSDWDILWDEKYKGNIYMLNQERDMISIALKKCGYSMNSNNDEELKKAEEALVAQKPLVKAYCGDEIKDNMINGGAALAVVWSGDAYYCMQQNADLAYAIPEEGSNLFFDCMVVPSTSTHQEEAEKFIDFMSRPEIAKLNAEYIGYSTANSQALELFDDSVKNDKLRYPDLSENFLEKMEIFDYNKERNVKLTDIWTRVIS